MGRWGFVFSFFFFFFARDIPTTTPGLVGLCVCTGCIHTKREPPSKKKKVKKNQKYLLESIQFDPIRLFRMSLISLFFFFFSVTYSPQTLSLWACVCAKCDPTQNETTTPCLFHTLHTLHACSRHDS